MAVAVRSGPSEARVPCPLCGGLVHPVAGRCKHCKADLAAGRAARPHAAAPLPQLGDPAPVVAVVANGTAGVAAATAAVVSLPVLPPRPTDAPERGESRGLRNWPLFVIAFAVLAIIAAVILLIWPDHHDTSTAAAAGHALAPPPAPENMNTNPMPRPQTPDPWNSNGATPTPPPPSAHPAPLPDDPAPDVDPDDDPDGLPHIRTLPPTAPTAPPSTLKNPFADPSADPLADPFSSLMQQMPSGGLRIGPNAAAFEGAVMKHLCDRLAQCDPASPLSSVCSMSGALGNMGGGAAPTCSAARRCLQMVDGLSCSGASDPSAMLGVFSNVKSCMEALSC